LSSERAIRLVVEYDGTGLGGWQRQANAPTVQQHLEEAVATMIGAEVPVVGASRTDAGVHALGQVACFRTTSAIRTEGFRLGLTSRLPEAIAVVAAEEAAADFHPRFSATGKRYRYSVFTRSARSPLLARTTWHRPGVTLDLAAMRAAVPHVLGEHDFSAFRAAGCTARTPHRRLDAIDVLEPAPHRVDIEVRGNAFLRNMVRILAGTLLQVAEGRLPPDQVAEILASRDRTRAGQTAPAHGLCLVEVMYGPPGERPAPGPRPGV
jgi:tRNA pseudouridine38-40 synthase